MGAIQSRISKSLQSFLRESKNLAEQSFLRKSKNLADVNNAIASGQNIQSVTSVELANDFGAGQYITFVRMGNLVVVRSEQDTIYHDYGSRPYVENFIPSDLAPPVHVHSVYSVVGGYYIARLELMANREFAIQRIDYYGNPTSGAFTSGCLTAVYSLI